MRSIPLRALSTFKSLLYSAIPVKTTATSWCFTAEGGVPNTSHCLQNSLKTNVLLKNNAIKIAAYFALFARSAFLEKKAKYKATSSHVNGLMVNNKIFERIKNIGFSINGNKSKIKKALETIQALFHISIERLSDQMYKCLTFNLFVSFDGCDFVSHKVHSVCG